MLQKETFDIIDEKLVDYEDDEMGILDGLPWDAHEFEEVIEEEKNNG